MFSMTILPLLLFSLLSFIPMVSSLIPDLDGDDPEPEPEPQDFVPVRDVFVPEGPLEPDDPVEENPVAEPSADATVIDITDDYGETSQIVLRQADQTGEDPVDVDGTEARDVIDASSDPTVAVKLNGKGGDDTISFGYSSSADGGAGGDDLDLIITDDALSNGNLEFGTVVFDDPDDVLTIEIEDDATGFLHEVRILSTEEPDADTEEDTETMFYILNQSETLSVDQEASIRAGDIVFEDGAQILAQIDLGTETATMGFDENGQPMETITGAINDTPMILLNRVVTSQLSFTVNI